MSGYSYDVTEATFQTEVIDASLEHPVLVDFWAPWCGPCRSLKPVLEKLAEEYGGRFRLAKVNSDDNPRLSMEYAVRSIPNVKAFLDGQLADEFMGAQPESVVRAFIERLLPNPAELARREARALLDAGQPEAAVPRLLSAVSEDPRNDRARVDLAEALFATGRLEEAQQALDGVSPLAAQNRKIAPGLARIRVLIGAAGGGSEAQLRETIESHPDDLAARLRLANMLVASGAYEEGLEQLLAIIRIDRSFQDDAARKTMIQTFELLGGDNPLVPKYRRLLASSLH